MCLIHPLDSAANTTVGKSKELSIDLEEHIIDLNKSGKSLEAISKQLQVPRSTVQTVSIKCMVQLENTSYHQLLRENCSGWSRVNQKPPRSKSAMNVKLLEVR